MTATAAEDLLRFLASVQQGSDLGFGFFVLSLGFRVWVRALAPLPENSENSWDPKPYSSSEVASSATNATNFSNLIPGAAASGFSAATAVVQSLLHVLWAQVDAAEPFPLPLPVGRRSRVTSLSGPRPLQLRACRMAGSWPQKGAFKAPGPEFRVQEV